MGKAVCICSCSLKKGIVRTDVILSIVLFILVFSAMGIYMNSMESVNSRKESHSVDSLLAMDRMMEGSGGMNSSWDDVEEFFINSTTGYVNITLSPDIPFNENATRTYLLPDWKETECWIISSSPFKIRVNASSKSYVVIVSNMSSSAKYSNPPEGNIDEYDNLYNIHGDALSTVKLQSQWSNRSKIRLMLSAFRIEVSSIDSWNNVSLGYNISSFQNIYSMEYPAFCANSTADIFPCNVTVMCW